MAAPSTKIMKCTCKHEFQDKTYGRGNRVHNIGRGTSPKAVCTVCSSAKGV
jgi:hypothetical protein